MFLGGVFLFSGIVMAVDTDSDGLDNAMDNNEMLPLWKPKIFFPKENKGIEDETLTVPFWGSGEIGTQVKLFEDETEVCAVDILGNGISVATANETTIDGDILVSEEIQAQFFYDTALESTSLWRKKDTASWYTGPRDDTSDSICDYKIDDGDGDPRGGTDDRCGEKEFPAKSILITTSETLFIFDAEGRSLWKKISLSNGTSLAAIDGKIFLGTTNGLKLFDFSTDDFSTTFTSSTTPAIIHNSVISLDTKTIDEKDFVLVGTQVGITLLNVTDSVAVSKSVSGIVDTSFTTDNRILFSTGSSSFISESSIPNLVSDWSVTDISLRTNFSSGLTNRTFQDFVGHSAGVTHVQSEGKTIRNIAEDFATIPLTGDVRGHWFHSFSDKSGNQNSLTNNGGVIISSVETGSDLQKFTFDGVSQYMSSADEDFDISGEEITVGMWIRRSNVGGTGDYQKVLNHGTSLENRNYFLSAGDTFFDYPIQEDPYFFGIRTENGLAAASIQSDPEVDTWEFIVGTYDGTSINIYKDGILEQNIPHSGNIIPNEEELRIGYGYGNEYFQGDIMLPFVAATAYSEEQIQRIYNLTKHWKTPEATVTLQTTSANVQDMVCHPEWNICYIATLTGITELNTQTGLTTKFLDENGITHIASSRLGTWECQKVMTSGVHSVFAQGFVQENASNQRTNNRNFYVYKSGDGDIDGDGLSNDEDNNPAVPIEKPVITLVQQSSEDPSIFTFSGTGDPGTGDIRTKVGLFKIGESTPFQMLDVGTNGEWIGTPESFESGFHTIFAKAYIEDNASTVLSEQTQIHVEYLSEGAPIPNILPEFQGVNNVIFSWNRNRTGVLFRVQLSNDSDFLTGISESGWISETSYNFQNLENGQTYFFRVKSKDKHGEETDYSEKTSTTIDTLPPSGITVSNDGNYSVSPKITFHWTNFTDTGGSGIDHFEVQVSTDNTFETTLFSDTHYETLQKSLEGIQGEKYFARVRAIDKVGNKSDYIYSSGTKVDTTPPSLPVLGKIPTPAPPGMKTISWTPSTDLESGIHRYEIFRLDNLRDDKGAIAESIDFRLLGTTTNTNYVDEEIQDGWQYVYKIIAHNQAGAFTESKTMQFTVDSTKTNPASFVSVRHYSSQDAIPLRWIAATDVSNPLSYEVLRNSNTIGTVTDISTRQYTDDTPKIDGTVYSYRIRAKSSDTDGNTSEEVNVLVDKTAPVSESMITGTLGDDGWYTSPILVTLSTSDGEGALFSPPLSKGSGFVSGIDTLVFNKNSLGITPYSAPIPFNSEGSNTLDFYAIDQAGNEETIRNTVIKIDTQNPEALFRLEQSTLVENGFTKENSIDFTSIGTDQTSGIASVATYVRFDENGDGILAGTNDFGFSEDSHSKISTTSGTNDTGTYAFSKDGRYEFQVVVKDNAGNRTKSSIVSINVDRTPPVTIDNAPRVVPAETPFTLTLSPNDRTISSGIERTYYTLDGSTPTTASSQGANITIEESNVDENGYFTVKYFSVDTLGNTEIVKIATNSPADEDGDEMPDDFELTYTDPVSLTSLDAEDDNDDDGLTNFEEYQHNTNPLNPDTDGDSVNDAIEVSDGTDPNNSTDHRVIFLAPITIDQPTDIPFVFLARAPIKKTISIKDSRGNVIGTGISDSSGKVAIELSLEAGRTHILSSEFIHKNDQIVSTKAENTSDDIQIDVQRSRGTNPKFINIQEGDIFSQGFIDIQANGKSNARMELFEIKDNNLVRLSQSISDDDGLVELGLPTPFLGGNIFIVDQDNRLTSEIIQVHRSVTVEGQVLSREGTPIKDAIAKFIHGGNHYTTTTNSNGNYTLDIPRNQEYTVKIYHRYYEKFEDTVFIANRDPKISPTLDPLEGINLEQTEDGVIVTETGGKITRYSGLRREDTDQVIYEPTLTYQESLESVKEIQKGVSGKVKTIITSTTGREVFAGYQSGRIAVDEFKVKPEMALKITGLLGSERRKGERADRFYSRVEQSICLSEKSEIDRPADVVVTNPYAHEIYELARYGILEFDEKKNFSPQKEITWSEVLEFLFAANCLEQKSLIELKKNDDLPKLEGFPLENSPQSLWIYTAVEQGILGQDFTASTLPTRREVLLSMISAFPIEINEKAKNTSFTDISLEDSIAPVLVATKQGGWFASFSEREFLPEKPLTREIFASWFMNALEHKKSITTQKSAFQKFIEKLRKKTGNGGQARPGVRVTSRSEADSHLTGREYRKNITEDSYYGPTRATWNPIDPNTTRKPLWIKDKSQNVRRQEPVRILRDIQKALDKVMEKEKNLQKQSQKEDDVGMLRRIFQGN
jgi:hypothetical protein